MPRFGITLHYELKGTNPLCCSSLDLVDDFRPVFHFRLAQSLGRKTFTLVIKNLGNLFLDIYSSNSTTVVITNFWKFISRCYSSNSVAIWLLSFFGKSFFWCLQLQLGCKLAAAAACRFVQRWPQQAWTYLQTTIRWQVALASDEIIPTVKTTLTHSLDENYPGKRFSTLFWGNKKTQKRQSACFTRNQIIFYFSLGVFCKFKGSFKGLKLLEEIDFHFRPANWVRKRRCLVL